MDTVVVVPLCGGGQVRVVPPEWGSHSRYLFTTLWRWSQYSLTNIDKFTKTFKLQLFTLFSIHFMKGCTSLMTCMLGYIQNYFYDVMDQKLSLCGLTGLSKYQQFHVAKIF